MNQPNYDSGAYNGPNSVYGQQSSAIMASGQNMVGAPIERHAVRESQFVQNYAPSMTPLTGMIFNERQQTNSTVAQSHAAGQEPRALVTATADYNNGITFSQPPTYRQYTSSGYHGSSIAGRQQSSVAGRYFSESSRVVGHEFGPERVVSVTSKVDSSKSHIVSERYVEHEVRVPKRVTREEIIEKTVIVPERILHEEFIEETAKVREKIIEVARPVIVEKIIEVPEYEYVERIVEVPEIVKKDRIQHVDKIIQEERIKEVVKVVPVEKVYEVPEIKYREVPVERVVHVDEWRDEIITKEVPKTQYVDQPVPNYVEVEKIVDVERNIPIPVEANITYEFRIPKIKPRYHKITYPVYLPRFVEVPVALELLPVSRLAESEEYLRQVGLLANSAASLCVIEEIATTIMNADLVSAVAPAEEMQSILLKKWRDGTLNIIPVN